MGSNFANRCQLHQIAEGTQTVQTNITEIHVNPARRESQTLINIINTTADGSCRLQHRLECSNHYSPRVSVLFIKYANLHLGGSLLTSQYLEIELKVMEFSMGQQGSNYVEGMQFEDLFGMIVKLPPSYLLQEDTKYYERIF